MVALWVKTARLLRYPQNLEYNIKYEQSTKIIKTWFGMNNCVFYLFSLLCLLYNIFRDRLDHQFVTYVTILDYLETLW